MSQLTYKWYDTTDDTVIIAGADSSSYTTESITQRRSYRCIVTEQYGNEKEPTSLLISWITPIPGPSKQGTAIRSVYRKSHLM